jgi:pyruvate dehydrogenase E1 component
MSDTREELRRHFEVDEQCITLGVLDALRIEGKIKPKQMASAIKDLGVDPEKIDPMRV